MTGGNRCSFDVWNEAWILRICRGTAACTFLSSSGEVSILQASISDDVTSWHNGDMSHGFQARLGSWRLHQTRICIQKMMATILLIAPVYTYRSLEMDSHSSSTLTFLLSCSHLQADACAVRYYVSGSRAIATQCGPSKTTQFTSTCTIDCR
jgi:hypothetical protein